MKRAALLSALCLVVFFSCEDDDFGLFDSGLAQNALEQKCVRYVDRDIEEPGDGLSWERALPTVEEAIESAKEEVGEESECEIRVKGEIEDKEVFSRFLPSSGKIKIVDNLIPDKTEFDFISSMPNIALKDKDKLSSFENPTDLIFASDTSSPLNPILDTSLFGIPSDVSDNSDYIPRSDCGCDSFDTDVGITKYGDVSLSIRNTATGGGNWARLALKADNYPQIDFADENGSVQGSFYWNMGYDSFFVNPNGGDFIFYDIGNVGIGTTGPNYKLQVHSSAVTNYLQVTNSVGSGSSDGATFGLNGSHMYIENQNSNGNMYFKTNGTTRMIIGTAGNVGIGTSTPDYELDVHGTVRAEEVIVELFTPDYVFEDGFDLMTLDEVENYIDENNHLPGFPPAAETDVNGVSLGDAHAALLQKVEELTLYLIEQNKELKAQKEEIEDLKNQVASCEL